MIGPVDRGKERGHDGQSWPQNLLTQSDLATAPTEIKPESAKARSLHRALSREESYLELVARLAREFAPVPVFELAKLHPPIRPHEFILLVTAEWQRLKEVRA